MVVLVSESSEASINELKAGSSNGGRSGGLCRCL